MQDEDPPAKLSPYRWYVLILLTIIYTVYNIDRNLVVILAEPIRQEFNLSDSQLGLLTGASFAVAFAIAGIPLGFLVDRTNRVRLISVLLAVWSAVTAACALVRSFPMLIATRVAIGAAESGASPTCMSLIADYFPKSVRGRVIGIFYLSTPIGLGIGFAIGGIAAQHMGWREVFFWAGAPGLLLAAITWLTVREPLRGGLEQEKGALLASSFANVFASIKQRPSLTFLILGAVASICAQAGISAFMPSLYVRMHGMELAQVGLTIALIKGVGGVIGMPLGGFISDYVSKRSIALSPLAVCFAMALSAPLAALGIFSPSMLVSIVAFFVYDIAVQIYLGPTMATYLSLAPANLRGAMSSFLIVAMNLVGFGVGALLTGAMSDLFLSMGIDQPLRFAMLAMTPFFLLSALFYFQASRLARADSERPWSGALVGSA
jgi:predicted MFS family arabinose efflux permease